MRVSCYTAFVVSFGYSCAAFSPLASPLKTFSAKPVKSLVQRKVLGPLLEVDPQRDDSIEKQSYGEQSRLFRRTVFTPEDWIKHRAPVRFFQNLVTLFKSGIFSDVLDQVLFIGGVATFVSAWNALAVAGYVDFQGIQHESLLHLPDFMLISLPQTQFNWSVSALGLLLVFRTNTAYFRWNEARSAWGKMINHTRSIMRQASTWTLTNQRYVLMNKYKPEGEIVDTEKAIEKLAMAVWAIPRSVTRHTLTKAEDEEAFQKDIKTHLSPTVADDIIASRSRPLRAMFYLSEAVDSLPLCVEEKVAIDNSVVVLADQIGCCERLLSAPIPLVYTRHTERFLSAFMFLLPLALWDSFGHTWNHLGMIPTVMILAFFFFGIEEIAIQLEEPFSVLPQKQMTENIFLSVKEYVKWHTIEKERNAKTRVTYDTLPLKGMPGSDMLNRMSGNEPGVPDFVTGPAQSITAVKEPALVMSATAVVEQPIYINGSTEIDANEKPINTAADYLSRLARKLRGKGDE